MWTKHPWLHGYSPVPSRDFPVLPPPGFVFWYWNAAGGRIEVSPERHTLFGAASERPQKASPEPWPQRLFEEERSRLDAACAACLEGRESSLDLALRARRLDEGWGWLLVRGHVFADETGQRTLGGYAVDVSRLSTDSRFFPRRPGNEIYQTMLEHSPDLVLRWDRHLFPLYANPAISRYLPSSAEELGNSTAWDLGVSEEQLEFHRNNVNAVFETGAAIKKIATFPTAVQGDITGEHCYWPECGPDGEVGSVIYQMRDLTEQIRTEQELRLSEERFSALYQMAQMQDAPEEEIIRFVLEQISLLTRSEHSYLFFPGLGEGGRGVIRWSRSMWDLIGPEGLPADKMPHQCCDGEHSFDLASEIRQPQIVNIRDDEPGHRVFGRLIVRRYVILPAMEEGRVTCIASVCNKKTDYDERDLRQLELFITGVQLLLRRARFIRDLRKAKETAEAANRVKDEFLANVSHELRTPLNGMLSMLQLLQLSPLNAEQAEYAHTASSSGATLLRILSDILDYSRMESGRMTLHAGLFDPGATLLWTMNAFVAEARGKGLDVDVTLDEALPRALIGDDARLRQIVFNLAGNALKFTERGGISLECSLLSHGARGKAWLYIVVRDTGVGIPPHAHSLIFEAFNQLDSSRTRKYTGTGLGLGIVKRLVDMMGGSLAVESEEGEGTAMHCVVPFEWAEGKEASQGRKTADGRGGDPLMPWAASPVPMPGQEARRLDILVAEDDPVSRFATRTFLRRAGHRAVCVDNGRLALEALLLHPFDCLFTDIQMPVMDGLETTRRIRMGSLGDIVPGEEAVAAVGRSISVTDRARRVPVPHDLIVVALTAHAMTGDREYFLRMGMDMYLSKPVILKELNAVLDGIARKVSSSGTRTADDERRGREPR